MLKDRYNTKDIKVNPLDRITVYMNKKGNIKIICKNGMYYKNVLGDDDFKELQFIGNEKNVNSDELYGLRVISLVPRGLNIDEEIKNLRGNRK